MSKVTDCPLCGSEKARLTSEDYRDLLRTTVQDLVNEGIVEALDALEQAIVSVNAGEPSPTEEKILNIIKNCRFAMEDLLNDEED